MQPFLLLLLLLNPNGLINEDTAKYPFPSVLPGEKRWILSNKRDLTTYSAETFIMIIKIITFTRVRKSTKKIFVVGMLNETPQTSY